MLVSRYKDDYAFSEAESNHVHALGADVITAHIVSVVSTGGTVKCHLQGSMDGTSWYDLGSDVTIATSTYTVITHIAADQSAGGKPGNFRLYRLAFNTWGGVWTSLKTWVVGEGHAPEDTFDTPLPK